MKKKIPPYICSKCNQLLTEDNWGKSDKLHGYYVCKSCKNKVVSKWKRNNKDKMRETCRRFRAKGGQKQKEREAWGHIKYAYGLSREECETQLKLQNRLCNICGKSRKLVIEHCHKTNKFRGYTCKGCNSKIAWLENYTSKIERHLKIKISETLK